MRVRFILGQSEGAETQEWNCLVVARAATCDQPWKSTLRRKIDLAPVILMPVLVSYVSDRQNGVGSECLLHSQAVLVAHRQVVIVAGDTGKTRGHDRHRERLSGLRHWFSDSTTERC